MLPILALLVVSLSGTPLPTQGATTICKDKTTSTATGKGACSGHGGVDTKATEAAAKAAKTAAAPATVICADGTTSAGGRGACSGHKGIAKTTAGPGTPPAAPAKTTAAPAKAAAAKTDTAMKGASKTPMKPKP